MSIRRNIVANYIGVGLSVMAPILALPWYISILGPKYWGLVSFISILLGILGLANAGLSQTLVREFSRQIIDPENGRNKIAIILFGFERIYWVFSVSMAILLVIFADTISVHWIKLGDIPVEVGKYVVFGAAAIFATQFPISIYRSVLIGSGEQVRQNWLMSSGTVVRHAGGVMLLYLYPSINTYLIWFVVVSLMETLITAKVSWTFLGTSRRVQKWDSSELKKLHVLAIGLSVSVILGVLTTQVDKIMLSWMMPIEQLGYYMIASTVAIGLLQIFSPIASAVQPRIVQLQDQPDALKQLNLRVLVLMLVMLTILVSAFIFAGKAILGLWLHDMSVVEIVYPVLALLVIGTGMNGIYNVGYMNWLAEGSVKKILRVNVLSLLLAIIFTPIFITNYGMQGAACGWLVINGVGMLFSLDWLKAEKTNHA